MKSVWRIEKLDTVCKVIGGGTPAKNNRNFYSGSIPWASVRDMKTETLSATEYSITHAAVQASSTKVIPTNNLVIATRVGLGKACLLAQDTAINQDLRAIIPRSSTSLDPRYLLRWFQSVAHTVEAAGTGATVKGVKLPFIKALRIPIPPLVEQKRIFTILDESFAGIATAIANTEKNLANAWELFQDVIDETIFDDADSEAWISQTVSELALPEKGAIRTGPFGSQLLHSEFVDEGIAVLGIDNAVQNKFSWGKRRFITKEKYATLKRYTVKPGDVLITIMGTCGRCAIVPPHIPTAINTKHLCCISLDRNKCLPEYLHAYFLYHPTARNFLQAHAKGSIMSGLNMGIIKALPVRLPSLETQRVIADTISKLSLDTLALESVFHRKLELLNELKQALLRKAFSGELTTEDETVQEALSA